MKIVCDIINSNMGLYNGILEDPNDIDDYFVNEEWVAKNFPTREFYLLKDQQNYVAMGSFQKIVNFAYIGYLHVKFAKFGNGYGSTMLKFLEIRAKREEITKMHLFTHPNATWAKQFYHKHGYTLCESEEKKIHEYENGALILFYGKNHVLWEKDL